MPRPDIKQAPAHIRRGFMAAQMEFGPYAAAQYAIRAGFYPFDIDALTPMHTEHSRFMAEGDPASANLIKNSNVSAWHDEVVCRRFVEARREWAETTSADDDQVRAREDVERRRLEYRERFAVARANEIRAQEEHAAHARRLDQARAEFDAQHPPPAPSNGAARKAAKHA